MYFAANLLMLALGAGVFAYRVRSKRCCSFPEWGEAGYRISFLSTIIFIALGAYFLLREKPRKAEEVF